MQLKDMKRNMVFYFFLLLGVYILINLWHDAGSKAGMEISPMVTVQSGVFVEKDQQLPVFTLGSKVKSPEAILSTEDALLSFSCKIQDGVPEKWIQAAVQGQKKGLHLLIELAEDDLENKKFTEVLGQIARYSPPDGDNTSNLNGLENFKIQVSLIPGQGMSTKDYHQFYQKVRDDLKKEGIENISLIWYPEAAFPEQQLEEDGEEVDGVGINISRAGDMIKLDKLYKIFADKKDIIINENIIDAHVYDLVRGMALLEDFYYALAVKYPGVTYVYQNSDLGKADAKYRKAMTDFRQKDWVTNLVLETTDKPMFQPLTEDLGLSGEREFLYRFPDDGIQGVAYVEYKFNTGTIMQSNRPPFAISVDTNLLHNGINSLTTVLYNKQSQVVHKQQVYFKVENENISPRAKRKGNLYQPGQKPVYAKKYIPVLMYHDFAPQVSKERSSSTVSAALFEKHLQALLDHGYTPVTFYDLDRYLNQTGGLPAKPVIITTDDGYSSNYTIAYPLLKKYQVSATFFVTTGFMGIDTQFSHISWEEAREMEESGFIDIQSHTHWHSVFSNLPEDQVLYETSISFGLIEKNLGKRDVKVLAYPEFRNTPAIRNLIQGEGVHLQVTNLADQNSVTSRQNVQRIHVHNGMSPEMLIKTIKKLTM